MYIIIIIITRAGVTSCQALWTKCPVPPGRPPPNAGRPGLLRVTKPGKCNVSPPPDDAARMKIIKEISKNKGIKKKTLRR